MTKTVNTVRTVRDKLLTALSLKIDNLTPEDDDAAEYETCAKTLGSLATTTSTLESIRYEKDARIRERAHDAESKRKVDE